MANFFLPDSDPRGAFLSQNIFSYIHTKLAARISHGYRDRHQCLMQARTLARCPRKQKKRPMISKNIMDRVPLVLILFHSIAGPRIPSSFWESGLHSFYYFYPITFILFLLHHRHRRPIPAAVMNAVVGQAALLAVKPSRVLLLGKMKFFALDVTVTLHLMSFLERMGQLCCPDRYRIYPCPAP